MRKVALEDYKSENTDQEIKDFTPEIQSLMKQDKDLIDKSQNAFVAFIRYYKEH